MEIEDQKEVAKEVYRKLKIIDPHCLLAGGAPRDWYFNQKCNDLDFYYVSTARTLSPCRKQLEKVFEGVEIKTLSEIHDYGDELEHKNLYKKMPDLVRVWQMRVDGITVQLVQLLVSGSQFKVVDAMDVSICKIWADVDLNLHPSPDFKKTIASNLMFLGEGYSWEDPHPNKMRERFKDRFDCASCEKQVDYQIVYKALNSI